MTHTAYIDPELHTMLLNEYQQGTPTPVEVVGTLARTVERKWGEDGYTMRLRGGGGRSGYAVIGHFDGSRFVLHCDRDCNVALLEPWPSLLAPYHPAPVRITYVTAGVYQAEVRTNSGSFEGAAKTPESAARQAYNALTQHAIAAKAHFDRDEARP